jgi:hypothetical protein
VSAVTEKFSDARTDRTSVFLAQIPSSRAVTSALRFDKGTKTHTKVEQGDTPGPQDDFDLQVRIDRSIVVDTRAQGKGMGSKELDPFWDQV